MSGLLFLLDVIAFVVVVFWICAIDGRGGSAARGLLGVKDAGPKAPKPPKRPGAGWRGAARSAGAGRLPATRGVPAASSSTPGWKRMPARSPPRPRA